MKKTLVFFGFLVIGLMFVQNASAQSKCPTNVKCLTFIGSDTYETNVQISDGAAAILLKNRIALEDNGTVLVWLDTCDEQDVCQRLDLTGRNPKKKVAKSSLNQTIKITAFGKSVVKIRYIEFDGDEGEALIVNGVYTKVESLN